MPTYDKRKQELKDRFTLAQGHFLFEETTRIMPVLDRYGEQRDDIITRLVFAATDLGDDKKSSNCESILAEGSKLGDQLNRMVDGVSDGTAEALAFEGIAVVEERRFWDTLAPLKLGDVHDRLLTLTANLKEYTRVLDAKWESISREDQALESDERRLTDEMNKMVKQTVDDGVPTYMTLSQSADRLGQEIAEIPKSFDKWLAEQGGSLGMDPAAWKTLVLTLQPAQFIAGRLGSTLVGSTASSVLSQLKPAIEIGRVYVNGYFAGKQSELRNKMPNQSAVLVTLSTTRQEADDFIQKNGMDVARKAYEDARSALQSWASSQISDGLKADASDVVAYLLEGFSKRLDVMDQCFKEFVSKHDGKFLGRIGPDIEQELLHTREWEDTAASFRGLALDEKLKLWRDNLQSVNLSLDNAFGQLSRNVEDLPLEVQDAMRSKIEEMRSQWMGDVKGRLEEAKKSLDAIEGAASAPKIEAALDRRQLYDTIRR